MSYRSRAWIVAASVAAVEAMKDQGLCRWNYKLRSLQQHAKNNLRCLSQANKKLSSASLVSRTEKATLQSEESSRIVMYLSCWALKRWINIFLQAEKLLQFSSAYQRLSVIKMVKGCF